MHSITIRKIKTIFTLVFVPMLLFAWPTPAFASTEDFYFQDFTADYYLSATKSGSSKLHVKEALTAVFPETNQNHGITRTIPFLNQAGKNLTVESKEALNLTALRNGKTELIAKITQDDTNFTIYLGNTNEYVHGVQTYTLEYDFTNVITEFDESGNNVSGKDDVAKIFQELYWDTNGTGWKQKFEKVTANFHIDSALASNLKPETWCYVGQYGEKGQERCQTSRTEDGFTFSAENLLSRENLTFVVHLTPGTFQVPIINDYTLVWLFIAEIVICLIIFLVKIKKWMKYAKPSYRLYKSTLTPPQYLPPTDEHIHVAEAEQLYLKKTRKSYVATLLELAVQRKVSVSKTTDKKHPRKQHWTIHLNVTPDTLSIPQRSMLEILHGKSGLTQGMDIPVEKHHPTKWLADCADTYNNGAKNTLERQEYIINNPSPNSKKWSLLRTTVLVMLIVVIMPTLAFLMDSEQSFIKRIEYVDMVGISSLPIITLLLFVFTFVFMIVINKLTKKYAPYTARGIKMVRYLEGLELYIRMAEKDRIAFLQSVGGADVTNAGIIKIYEKLLPWASLFGLETSWLKELSQYYDVSGVPSDFDATFMDGLTSGSIANDIMRSLQSSTNYHDYSSLGSGWSSSDSGGGGSSSSSGGGSSGGSGGGGGGGGGGGW